MIAADMFRPCYEFLYRFSSSTMLEHARRLRDPDGFARLGELCESNPRLHRLDRSHSFNQLARILIHNGGRLADITVEDCVEAYRAQVGYTARQQSFWYVLLRQAGILPVDTPPSIWAASRVGRVDVAALVDRYQLECGPVRDLIVDYLRERQAGLDFSTLNQLSRKIAMQFWRDLELHHPGIDTLHLSQDAIAAWKQRLQVVAYGAKKGRRREDPNSIYLTIRGFYADLADWAQRDPNRWAQSVAPSPITATDLMGQNKAHHRATSRMQQRTRELAPHLPVLAAAAADAKRDTAVMLRKASVLAHGESFLHNAMPFVVATIAPSANNPPRAGVT